MGPCECSVVSPSSRLRRPAHRLRRRRHPVPPRRRRRGGRPDDHHQPRRPGDRRLLHGGREGQQGPGAAAAQPPLPLRYLTHEFADDLIIGPPPSSSPTTTTSSPTSSYKTSLAQLEPQLAKLSDDQQDAVVEIIGARAYVAGRAHQHRRHRAEEAGHAPTPPTTTSTAAGQKVLTTWIADHDVEVNPKYGVDLGQRRPRSTPTSPTPLGTTAKAAAGREPDGRRRGLHERAARPLVCLD